MSRLAGDAGAIYRVSVRSILDEGWIRALELKPIASHRHYAGPPRTILMLQLADQAALISLLQQLHDMGLTLLSVELSSPERALDDNHTSTHKGF
jgi:hypothetical protein